NAAREIKMLGEMEIVQSSLRSPSVTQLPSFLDDLLKHQQKYDLIFTVDQAGRLMSVNSIAASALGKSYRLILPDVPDKWLEDVIKGDVVTGIPWTQVQYVNDLYQRTATTSREERQQLILASPITAHEGGDKFGVIVALVNWSNIQHILDGTEER